MGQLCLFLLKKILNKKLKLCLHVNSLQKTNTEPKWSSDSSLDIQILGKMVTPSFRNGRGILAIIPLGSRVHLTHGFVSDHKLYFCEYLLMVLNKYTLKGR